MWVVTVISPWEEPREYVLKAGKTMLGRHPGNDIVIPDDASSRLHAEIDYDLISNAITVRDLDSTNGTWVNRQRIREVQPLRVNDHIHIGQHLLTLIQRDHSTSGRTARLHSNGDEAAARRTAASTLATLIDQRRPPAGPLATTPIVIVFVEYTVESGKLSALRTPIGTASPG